MTATPNSQAIQVANQLMSLSQQLISVYQQMLTLDAAWSDDAIAATLAAMTTTALNTDGTPGAVDGAPSATHPISLTVYPTLSRAVTSTQLGQAKTIMDGIVAYVGGSAVTTQVGARAILNIVSGG
jgi:hypothetical protein